MKKTLLLVVLFFGITTAFAQWDDDYAPRKKKKEVPVLPIDEKNGFKMVRFGETVDSYREDLARPLGLGADTMFFVKTSELLQIGDIPLKKFTIATKKGIVYAVMLEIEGYAKDIKDIFVEAYGGKYETPNQFMKRYIWRGKKVALIYDYNSIANVITCTMTGLEVLKVAEEIDAQKNKERSKDL